MTHPGIDLFQNIRVHFCQKIASLIDSANGYVGIGVAGADKNGGSLEVAAIVLRVELVADEAARECQGAAISFAIACQEHEQSWG